MLAKFADGPLRNHPEWEQEQELANDAVLLLCPALLQPDKTPVNLLYKVSGNELRFVAMLDRPSTSTTRSPDSAAQAAPG